MGDQSHNNWETQPRGDEDNAGHFANRDGGGSGGPRALAQTPRFVFRDPKPGENPNTYRTRRTRALAAFRAEHGKEDTYDSLSAARRRALQGHFTRRMDAAREARGEPPLTTEEAARLFRETFDSEKERQARREAAERSAGRAANRRREPREREEPARDAAERAVGDTVTSSGREPSGIIPPNERAARLAQAEADDARRMREFREGARPPEMKDVPNPARGPAEKALRVATERLAAESRNVDTHPTSESVRQGQLSRISQMESNLAAKGGIRESRQRRVEDIQQSINDVNRRMGNATDSSSGVYLRHLRDSLTQDMSAIRGRLNLSETGIRSKEAMISHARQQLEEAVNRNTESLERATGRRDAAARTAEEARRALESTPATIQRPAAEVRAEREAERARYGNAPEVHGVRIAIPAHRTEAELKGAYDSIKDKWGESSARAAKELFGDRVPDAKLIAAGFSTKDHVTEITSFTGRSVHGKIVNSVTGETMNNDLSRSYRRDRDGVLAVHHNIFTMKPEYAGSGVGSQVISNSFRMHHAMGIRRVDVSPAYGGLGTAPNRKLPEDTAEPTQRVLDMTKYDDWERNNKILKHLQKQANGHLADMKSAKERGDTAAFQASRRKFDDLRDPIARHTNGWNGAYVWASLGFSYTDPDYQSHAAAQKLASYLTREHRIPSEKAARIAASVKHSPYEISALTYQGKQVGKHFLHEHFSGSWGGDLKMEMTPGTPEWQTMKRRLRLEDLP